VPPAYTSQTCSGCGVLVHKGLSVRWHACPECGISLHRDQNAATNPERCDEYRKARAEPSGSRGVGCGGEPSILSGSVNCENLVTLCASVNTCRPCAVDWRAVQPAKGYAPAPAVAALWRVPKDLDTVSRRPRGARTMWLHIHRSECWDPRREASREEVVSEVLALFGSRPTVPLLETHGLAGHHLSHEHPQPHGASASA